MNELGEPVQQVEWMWVLYLYWVPTVYSTGELYT